MRAARLVTDQLPKPTRVTLPPFLRVPCTEVVKDSSARSAAALEISASDAMRSISSDLFIGHFHRLKKSRWDGTGNRIGQHLEERLPICGS